MRALLCLVLATNVAAAEPMVTKAFMREIAAGKRPPRDLIDPARGLVSIVYISGETEPSVTKRGQHLCAAAAERALGAMIRDHLKRAVPLEERFECRNRPGPPTCTVGVIGEGMTTANYVFRTTGDRLVLDTMILTNSVYNPDDEAKVVARYRARYAGATCD
jgi:hypothetical protein